MGFDWTESCIIAFLHIASIAGKAIRYKTGKHGV